MFNNSIKRYTHLIKCFILLLIICMAPLFIAISAQGAYIRTPLCTINTLPLCIAVQGEDDFIVGTDNGSSSSLLRITECISTPIIDLQPCSGCYGPKIYDVKIEQDGNYVVAEFGSPQGQLTRISPDGSTTSVIYAPGYLLTPLSVAIDRDGGYIAYVSDFYDYQALHKISNDGNFQTEYPLPLDSRGNGRVAVDNDGNYIIAQAGDSPTSDGYERLLKVDHETKAVSTIYQFNNGTYPFGVAVDSDGNYIVTEVMTNTLSKITKSGEREVLFQFDTGTQPFGIDIDAKGNFIVTEVGTKAISMISPEETTVDTTPPVISVSVTPSMLWPANHKMVNVSVAVSVTDDQDPNPTVALVSVESNEPDDAVGNGDGSTVNDIQGADIGSQDYEMLLRAERDGNGQGRVYTITYSATDASGNRAIASATVVVPHDRGK